VLGGFFGGNNQGTICSHIYIETLRVSIIGGCTKMSAAMKPGIFIHYWDVNISKKPGTDTSCNPKFGRIMTLPSGGQVHVQSFL
jgi:hypothetical protein